MGELDKVGAWAKTVGQWLGDSPYKAATAMGVAFVAGAGWVAFLGAWPF